MSLSTFKRVVDIANDYGEYVCIGGGEPTVHKRFEDFLAYAIAFCDTTPYIITNGKLTQRGLLIADLISKEKLDGELSIDNYHEKINDTVIKAFKGKIRNTTRYRNPIPVGRAMYIHGVDRPKQCRCDGIFVRPSGKIYQCGCVNSKCIGNSNSGITTEVVEGGCSNNYDC